MAEEDARTGASDGDCGGTAGCSGAGGVNGDDEGEQGTNDSSPCGGAGGLTGGNAGGDEGWLQLGIGRSCCSNCSRSTSPAENGKYGDERPAGLLELNLFSDKPSGSGSISEPRITDPTPSSFMSSATGMVPLSNGRWGMLTVGNRSSGSIPPPFMAPPIPFVQKPMYNATPGCGNQYLGLQIAEGGRSPAEMRVVVPPPRPQNGLWFMLQASQNQDVRQPFLPQLTPKSYLRIKDERMTVRLLMKYLACKLGLESESEVEITCRGQVVYPHLTLQHVRDNVWCKRDIVALLPDSTIDHLMTLQYGRSTLTISSSQVLFYN